MAFQDAARRLKDRDAHFVKSSPLSFAARDGYSLKGTLYKCDAARDSYDCVVFNAGAGLAASRYRRFLTWIAQAGVPVLAYDYRGVAQDERVDAGLEHWSELDHAGALDFAASLFRGYRISTISHSIGCMVAAGAPNADRVHRMVFVAPHVGYWGDYQLPWRYPMWLLWHLIAPTVARVSGSFPAHKLHLGDRIPATLARQWGAQRADMKLPPSLMPVEVRERLLENAARLALPALVVTFNDDAFVGATAVPRFISLLPDLRSFRWHIEGPAIGHWSYFRQSNAELWPPVVDFLLRPLSAALPPETALPSTKRGPS